VDGGIMPIKKDFTLELSKEEKIEISKQINETLVLLSKHAGNFAKMYYRNDPNMVNLIFDRLVLNYILNLVSRLHKIEQEYTFEVMDELDKEMNKGKLNE